MNFSSTPDDKFKKLCILFQRFIVVFHKQVVNTDCSIVSISRPISSHNLKAADQAIAMDSYQSYFRKQDIFLKNNLLYSPLPFLHGGNDL